MAASLSSSSSVADAVVRAVAWDDGGVECVYADGTVLSFVDHMNTFVAARSRPSSSGTPHSRNLRGQRGAARGGCGAHRLGHSEDVAPVMENIDAAHNGGGEEEEGGQEAGRELCFTAWALSRDAAKVRAALAIYNALAPHPRLLTTLLPTEAPSTTLDPTRPRAPTSSFTAGMSSAAAAATLPPGPVRGVWREPGPPIDTLLLVKDRRLFRRHPVVGTVREWLVQPSPSAHLHCSTSASRHASALPCEMGPDDARCGAPPCTADLALQDCTQDGQPLPQDEDTSTARPCEVVVGTVLELWCALRRVRLTVAVHRETFTVRWPAPVTRPDGSRLPPALHVHDAVAAVVSSHAAPLLFTVVEQTFPVRDPPEQWRVMLELALELDAATPKRSTPLERGKALDEPSAPAHTLMQDTSPPSCEAVTDSAPTTWQGSLPEPQRWSGELNQHRSASPCRFSPLTVAQAAHVVAPRTSRALAAMRALHSPSARLRWVYEAPGCGVGRDHPPAVHWCVDAEGQGSSAASTSLRGVDTVSWVGEDGSVVLTRLHGQGYTVTHHRLGPDAAAPVLYRLQANDSTSATATPDRRLPPTVAPLRCHFPSQTARDWNERDAGGHQDGDPQLGVALQLRRDANIPPHAATRSTCVQEEQDSVTTGSAAAIIDAFSLRCVDDSYHKGNTMPEKFGARTHRGELHLAVQPCSGGRGATCFVTPASVCRLLIDLGATDTSTVLANACYAGPPHAVRDEEEARRAHLRGGRYLSAVVDSAVQLSQVNCTACRDGAGASAAGQQAKLLLMATAASRKDGRRERHGNVDTNHISVSANPVVYLTSQLEGIGTFTALTNGTVRAQFDDRTLLTLIPGPKELDEAQLLVSCVLRNATRFTVRAVQCREGHAAYRYLAYALPFRRYVYWRAVHPEESETPMAQPTATAQAATSPPSSLMEAPLLEASVGHLPSVRSDDLATSFGDPEERGVEMQAADRALGGRALVASGPVPRSSRVAWGITDSRDALESVREHEAAELRARAAKLQELLDTNDALSQATRALLRE